MIASSSTPENEGPQRKDLESVGTSLSSLSNLTPVLPPTAKRRYALASLRLLWYGGHARHPRGCGANTQPLPGQASGAAELELGDWLRCFFIPTPTDSLLLV